MREMRARWDRRALWASLLLAALALMCYAPLAGAQDDSVVRVVYFTSSECPICRSVVEEVLNPLQAEYGDRLQIKVVDITNQASRYALQCSGIPVEYGEDRLGWRTEITGDPLTEGDEIDLGGIRVEIIETPGHSTCSITAYCPQFQALFPSDGCGIPLDDKLLVLGTSDYTRYQHSLEKLKDLKVRFMCSDHYGCVTGPEAETFVVDSIQEAWSKRKVIEEIYQKTGDIEAAAGELVERYGHENVSNLTTPEVFKSVYVQIVKHIAAAKEINHDG